MTRGNSIVGIAITISVTITSSVRTRTFTHVFGGVRIRPLMSIAPRSAASSRKTYAGTICQRNSLPAASSAPPMQAVTRKPMTKRCCRRSPKRTPTVQRRQVARIRRSA
jgi:hypothetical protein